MRVNTMKLHLGVIKTCSTWRGFTAKYHLGKDTPQVWSPQKWRYEIFEFKDDIIDYNVQHQDTNDLYTKFSFLKHYF